MDPSGKTTYPAPSFHDGTSAWGSHGEALAIATAENRFRRFSTVANLLLWPLLAVLFATHFSYTNNDAWTFSLLMGGMIWLPWMVLAPVVVLGVKQWCKRPRRPIMDICAWMAGLLLCVGTYSFIVESGMMLARDHISSNRFPPFPPRDDSPRMGPRPPRPHAIAALPIYLGITTFAGMAVARQKMVERERRALQDSAELHKSRLEMLYAQLRPHFLFNALNTIASLVHRSPEVVDGIVTSLGVLLHETLESDARREVALERELELVKMYVDIERARFGDELKLRMDVPAECLALSVPVLILQPLVENAVRHGLGPQKGRGTIFIKVRLDSQRQRLRIVVQDDGVGIKEVLRNGIGLANTRARLRVIYGESESLAVVPAEGGGSLAILELPRRSWT